MGLSPLGCFSIQRLILHRVGAADVHQITLAAKSFAKNHAGPTQLLSVLPIMKCCRLAWPVERVAG